MNAVKVGGFIAYEKEVTTVLERTTHIIRIQLGSSAAAVVDLLKQVPSKAAVDAISAEYEDGHMYGYGTIFFTEERVRN